MNDIGKPERVTQKRVVDLFRNELRYRYLGDYTDRSDNSNFDDNAVGDYLTRAGYSLEQISRALYLLRLEAKNRTAVSTIITKRFTLCCATACR